MKNTKKGRISNSEYEKRRKKIMNGGVKIETTIKSI